MTKNLLNIIEDRFDIFIASHNDLERLKKLMSALKGLKIELRLDGQYAFYEKKILELGNPMIVQEASFIGNTIVIKDKNNNKLAFPSIGVIVTKVDEGLVFSSPNYHVAGVHLKIFISEGQR